MSILRVFAPGILRPPSAAAPTINGSQSLASFPTPADPTVVSLAGQTYTAGDYALFVFGNDGTVVINGVAGSAGDTYAEIVQMNETGTTLGVFEGTINGGALDANINVDLGSARDAVGGLITISGAAANANQPDVLPSAHFVAGDVSPSCLSITTITNRCRVFAIFHARGGHVTANIQSATPSGWTFLFAGSTGLTGGSTAQSSMGIAYKVQETAGPTGDATWTNALSVAQNWTSVQVAIRP